MPMRANIGLSRKVGQPDYGSLGASCHLDIELDGAVLQQDPDLVRRHVRNVFALCSQAVDEELVRQQSLTDRPPGDNGQGASRPAASAGGNGGNGHRRGRNGNGDGSRGAGGPPMTASQRRAIFAIAHRLNIDPADEANHEFGVELARMTVGEASKLIDHLKSRVEPAGQEGGGP